MAKHFGTDGVRGVANRQLTPEFALALARAHGHFLLRRGLRGGVVIGCDTRVSSPMLQAAYSAGLASVGIDSNLLGMVPTPAVAWLTQQQDYLGGVMISASHNPVPDNGIKLFAQDGFKLSDSDCQEIEAWLESPDIERPIGSDIGTLRRCEASRLDYLEHLKALCPEGLKGLKIVLDCAHGAACELAPQLFADLGAETIVIHGQPDGRQINVGCGSTDLSHLRQAVLAQAADLGLAFDGDADRCLGVDESGQSVDGDRMLLLFARWMKEKELLPGDQVVATVMSNYGLELALADQGIQLIRAQVGDRYVLEEMLRLNCPLGGEQSGHLIFSAHCTTGDGLLSGLRLAACRQHRGIPLSRMVGEFPALPQKIVNVRATRKEQLHQDPGLEELISRQAARLQGRGRLLVRPSGTEPLVRLMAEGPDEVEIDQILEELRQSVSERLN